MNQPEAPGTAPDVQATRRVATLRLSAVLWADSKLAIVHGAWDRGSAARGTATVMAMVGLQFSGQSGVPVLAVVGASLALVLLVLALSSWLRLGIHRDLVIASVRAAVQLLTVGVIFTALFGSSLSLLWAWSWIGLMVVVSTRVVLARARHRIDRLALVSVAVIGGSAAMSLSVTFGLRVLEFSPVALVVIAGITIGNAMPSTVLGVNQSITLARDHRGEIEAALALGFDRRLMMRYLAPRAARAALIPQIERTKVVGLIALPGAMTGLLLAGVAPMEAVVLQLIVMYLVVGAASLCVVGVTAATCSAAITDDVRASEWTRPEA